MGSNKGIDYFAIPAPSIEDAGLEDPALPIEGIQEAFRRAAGLMEAKAAADAEIDSPWDGCMDAVPVKDWPNTNQEGIDRVGVNTGTTESGSEHVEGKTLLEGSSIYGKSKGSSGESDPDKCEKRIG
ncbi:hypothetical protein KP509_37G023600 [Ceratopteris richardii]|uniref:Uncharacterized protein n=1 Tax=Ceratopteris richardii TaxID=49495 RepID=A0A8T2Q6F0_CERRI|nr:hypothetical protein KP509_37G023600 [Ceratopteris richardii]